MSGDAHVFGRRSCKYYILYASHVHAQRYILHASVQQYHSTIRYYERRIPAKV